MDEFAELWDNYRKLIIIILAALMIFLIGFNLVQKYKDSKIEEISYLEFQKLAEEETINLIEYSNNEDIMVICLNDGTQYKTAYPDYEDFRKDMLEKGVSLKRKGKLSSNVILTFLEVGIVIVYVAMVLMLTRGFGNIRERDILQHSDVKFNQVVGLDEIMDDISLYVAMLKNPKIGDEIGAKMPKGVLLAGNPGTGKTLIAKAIAGEADVPFISVTGSEFVELYKGVGAKRVRKVFEIARKNAPCVIFIDEIDAIGGRRDLGDVDSEDTQTINQLLKEMDGFDDLEGVFVLAATNCPDNLDDALRRSGRFDRQVNIMPPRDWKVRKQLLDLYLKEYKVSEEVDTEVIAKAIAGFTGADIAMICNEASLVAISKGESSINRECIDEAIDKKIFNGNRAKTKQYERDREIVTYHEAGHAVMKYLLKQPISRASIVATTSGVGGAVFGEDKEGMLRTSQDIIDNILVCYAGRASERIKFGDVSTGSVNDISKATDYIVSLIYEYGFDEKTGAIDIKYMTDREISTGNVSERVMKLAKKYEKQAEEILSINYELVERLAKVLSEKEIMTGSEVDKVFK